MSDPLDLLTNINLDDLVDSFGWGDAPFLAALLKRAFRNPARMFADQMLAFDRDVGALGFPKAGLKMISRYARTLKVYGYEAVPEGPVLFLSNHPGMVDTLALFAAIRRRDLRVIAIRRPFLAALRCTSERLDYLIEDSGTRVALVRAVSAHLRAGGAVLTFPSGRIEPDPDVYPGAVEALQDWTDSVEIFTRIAPLTAVVPILVRGVIWPRTADHFLVRLRKDREERERLAAALQLLGHVILKRRPLDVAVHFGKPIYAADLRQNGKGSVHDAVIAGMQDLIINSAEGECEELLKHSR